MVAARKRGCGMRLADVGTDPARLGGGSPDGVVGHDPLSGFLHPGVNNFFQSFFGADLLRRGLRGTHLRHFVRKTQLTANCALVAVVAPDAPFFDSGQGTAHLRAHGRAGFLRRHEHSGPTAHPGTGGESCVAAVRRCDGWCAACGGSANSCCC